jgi:hypothetical protein
MAVVMVEATNEAVATAMVSPLVTDIFIAIIM